MTPPRTRFKDLREGEAGRKAKEALRDLRDGASGRSKS